MSGQVSGAALHPAIVPSRVAVITGAASGIGRAAAQRLGDAGMRLVLADIAEEALNDAAEQLRSVDVEVRAIA